MIALAITVFLAVVFSANAKVLWDVDSDRMALGYLFAVNAIGAFGLWAVLALAILGRIAS